MLRDDIISMVNEVFVDEFEQDPNALVPDVNIFTDLGLDSLDTVDLIVALQKKFKVTIRGDAGVRDIRTLNDLYDFIERLAEVIPG